MNGRSGSTRVAPARAGGTPTRISTWYLVAAASLAMAACSGEPPEPAAAPPDTASGDTAVTEVASAQTRRAPPLPAAMQRVAQAGGFPHDPHVEVACARCHEAVAGHDTHQSVGCRECHAATTTAPAPASASCLACHHAEDQARTCQDCHAPVPPTTVERSVRLAVWPAARTRALPFDHETHVERTCATCHTTRPELEASAGCESCHQNHHREDAVCLQCHQEAPAGTHALGAHLGCAGAGCHSDPVVLGLTQSPSQCLVCHQAQVDHNSGSDCADCHQVRGLAAPSNARPAPGEPWRHW